ncbi:MAG: hypothetical protein KME35_18490 [Aphanocapsa sp. GSE-SYN-MK-11-07L]|nr:hypothetical protein [Aphanocapsa sp. GSE-SYN-MK-11-07L]
MAVNSWLRTAQSLIDRRLNIIQGILVGSDYLEVLQHAAQALAGEKVDLPRPGAIVTALLQAEKAAKQDKLSHLPQQLLGSWRLGFITGTKKSRQRAGIVLGAGRFLPTWLKINLAYTANAPIADPPNPEQPPGAIGTILNQVQVGSLQFRLNGPMRFWDKNNIISFDFTQMTLLLWGRSVYQGYIRNGRKKAASFHQQPLKEQAFFSYFLVQDQFVAARGRGGGLALWTKAPEVQPNVEPFQPHIPPGESANSM